MADEEVVVNRDYTDNFSLKEFALSELAPKYFPDVEVNKLNIGMIGMTTELIGNVMEDSFRTTSTLINEVWPNRAQIPESIYSHAAIFQLDANFATAAKCQFIFAIKEEDLLNAAETKDRFKEFILDKDTQVIVSEKIFTFDYDVIIRAQKHRGEWSYSAQYDMAYTNSISDLTNQYIRIRRSPNGYLLLIVYLRQVVRQYDREQIIDNSKLNLTTLEVSFEGQLAGFDALYTKPDGTVHQLTKSIMYTSPLKTPFCYYKFKDDNTLLISFSNKDSYFQPEFNSEITIQLYTTSGEDGNFEKYTGNDINVILTDENYENNSNIITTAQAYGSSSGGFNGKGLEALRDLTIEAYSTTNSITTENDLEIYFRNYVTKYGTDIKFIKKRNDIFEHLFSAFMIIKDEDYIYPTNTLNITFKSDKSDITDDSLNEFTLKPGHLFKYVPSSSDTGTLLLDSDGKSVMAYDSSVECSDDDFMYMNPFLMRISRKPNSVGFYMTIMDQNSILDFGDSNDDSFVQFMSTRLLINRGLSSESKYTASTLILPTVDADKENPYVTSFKNDDDYNPEKNMLRTVIVFRDGEREVGFIEMDPIKEDTGSFEFSCSIETDDYITSTNKFRCLNLTAIGEQHDFVYIPTADCVVEIYTLHKDPDISSTPLFGIDTYSGYVVTNKYLTENYPITFIRPLNMLRSTVSFSRPTTSDPYTINLSFIPLIKWNILQDSNSFRYFVNVLADQYDKLENALSVLTNNSHIDLKFYNTYGKSKNFLIGDDGEVLNRVNIKIKLKIATHGSSDFIDTANDVKKLVKEYIETLNTDGTNNIYISNLMREIENNIPDVKFIRFLGINEYSSDYQTIVNNTVDLDTLTKNARRNYVPEMLVINTDDILITEYE